MKNKRFPFLIMAALSVLIIGYSFWQCTGGKEGYKVITLTGTSFANNMSKTHFSFGSMAEEGDTTAMLVSEGDLLYLFSDSDNPLIFRYRKSDGNHLDIVTDTSTLFRADMNGKLHTLYLYDEDDVSDWNNNKDLEALADLRAVNISGSVIRDNYDVLEEIAGINPSVGLSVDEIDDPVLFARALSLFNPSWLILPELEENMLNESLLSNLNKLETLYFVNESMIDYNLLYKLPLLQSLIIENWVPDESNPIHFDQIKNLRSLSLVNSELGSLSVIKDLPGLRSLALIDCDDLTDISALSGFTRLRQLSLLSCDTLTDISVLNELPMLQSLSFPPAVNQAEFSQILAHHSSLQTIELIECNEIEDLSPLEGLDKLISLSIAQEEIDFEALSHLSSIELIVIDENNYDDSDPGFLKLVAALPGTYIVPGGGFCMGSGWILLLLPVVLAATAIRKFVKR